MNVTAVESTTLSTIAYDDARDLLQLEFRSGAVYQLLRRSCSGALRPSARILQGNLFPSDDSGMLCVRSGDKSPTRRTGFGIAFGEFAFGEFMLGGCRWHELRRRYRLAVASPITSA